MLQHDPVPSGKKIHPVEKPVSLIRQLIESSTAPGETVVDFFGGSGSTAEAAYRLAVTSYCVKKIQRFMLELWSGSQNLQLPQPPTQPLPKPMRK